MYTNCRLPITVYREAHLLNMNAFLLLIALGRFYNSDLKMAFPTNKNLSIFMKKDERSVRRSMRELIEKDFILRDEFRNIDSYPVNYSGFFKSNAKFYLLPDFLIMDIENSFNRNKVDKKAVVVLKYSLKLLNNQDKMSGLQDEMSDEQDGLNQISGQNKQIYRTQHVDAINNYYNELVKEKIDVFIGNKENHATENVVINIKDSFNSNISKNIKNISNISSIRKDNSAVEKNPIECSNQNKRWEKRTSEADKLVRDFLNKGN